MKTFDECSWAKGLMYKLDAANVTVKQYPYRSADVKHILFEVERNDLLENFLALKAKKKTDNHTLYEITFNSEDVFYIRCSDWKMFVGIGLVEKYW